MTISNKQSGKSALHIQEISGRYRKANTSEILAAARSVLNRRFRRGTTIGSPKDTSEFLQMRFAGYEHETFAILWLDNRHRVIEFDEIFRGTIDNTTVYPREVVKTALHRNAAACILAHNHPSGVAEPSQADELITRRLKDALDLIDVRLLDHIVVGDTTVSLAERGLI